MVEPTFNFNFILRRITEYLRVLFQKMFSPSSYLLGNSSVHTVRSSKSLLKSPTNSLTSSMSNVL